MPGFVEGKGVKMWKIKKILFIMVLSNAISCHFYFAEKKGEAKYYAYEILEYDSANNIKRVVCDIDEIRCSGVNDFVVLRNLNAFFALLTEMIIGSCK